MRQAAGPSHIRLGRHQRKSIVCSSEKSKRDLKTGALGEIVKDFVQVSIGLRTQGVARAHRLPFFFVWRSIKSRRFFSQYSAVI